MQPHIDAFNCQLKDRLEPSALAYLQEVRTPVAVACSGGPDSIAAALVAKAYCPAPLTLLHFNHRLRGAAADADAAFVENFARQIGADFRLGVWQTPNAQNETAAREARLNFLHQWEHETIVMGHHADDAVETLLMRLARGATLEGLCAPHPLNRMRLHVHVRPLLTLRKAQIVEALTTCNIPFRTDETNLDGDYLRNRIRNELLPLWQKLETRDVVAGILASQEHLRAAHIASSDPSAASNKEASAPSASAAAAARSAGAPPAPPSAPVPLPFNTTLHLPGGFTLSASRIFAPKPADVAADSLPLSRVFIDANSAPLFIRAWAPGDRYTPFNAPGSRKVKELLSENAGQFAPDVRAQWPVVVDERGNALWLPGCRIAHDAAIPANATHAIELNFTPPAARLSSK